MSQSAATQLNQAETPEAIPEVLPGIELSQQQWQALLALEAFVHSSEKIYLLTGYAGTGKTTLLQALITRLQQQRDSRPIALTALSNKATKVLQSMAYRWGCEVDCMTCCKLLGLKPVIDKETGGQKFEPDRDRKNLTTEYDLVVVDECSMINVDMWDLLISSVSRFTDRTQLLFVGDSAQLPPVGEIESPCFANVLHRSDLTEVIRYGGAIGLLAEDVRTNLERTTMPQAVSDRNATNTEGIFTIPRAQWEKLMLRAFKSEAYEQNPDQVRVLAYTNNRVNYLNNKIRAAIYGEKAARFMAGERLVARNACMGRDGILLQTSEECQVLAAYLTRFEGWLVWELEVETDDYQERKLRVLHEDEQQRFKELLSDYSEKKQWMAFWDYKELFHDLSYAYSLTVHKSQGSTFQDVFVDVPNLMLNRKVIERNQLYYVAFTRAAKRLFLST
ncbi:ATP-dependent RecD-like DNA helicase [cf. Phormidesmis sp. LEGE 11477]|uniref:ATP-dependent DNA helicase n=1 Tax=cf. Phormidesmis sp. LEGE 11477 TaxID=1828680 RepID=UPI0018801CBF|nr:AAA family ATPase [cf. Phormidesmis sp. LEGE 11477]MBE9061413.1 AAA family ATPase [cf. Phormidesmis sp. LEGE 11477]